jgi:hypothetical protein
MGDVADDLAVEGKDDDKEVVVVGEVVTAGADRNEFCAVLVTLGALLLLLFTFAVTGALLPSCEPDALEFGNLDLAAVELNAAFGLGGLRSGDKGRLLSFKGFPNVDKGLLMEVALFPEIFPTGGCCGRGTALVAVLAIAVDSLGATGNFGPVVLLKSELVELHSAGAVSFFRGFAIVETTTGEDWDEKVVIGGVGVVFPEASKGTRAEELRMLLLVMGLPEEPPK